MELADISGSLAEVAKLPDDKLNELCHSESDEKYDEIVIQSGIVRKLEDERELLLASTRSLAEFNLARQNEYESDRFKLLTLVGDTNCLKREIEDKSTKLSEMSRRTSLESTLAVVLEATAQAEKDSENVATRFLDNSIDYDTFLSQYTDKRTLAHLRRIKADRLRQETKVFVH